MMWILIKAILIVSVATIPASAAGPLPDNDAFANATLIPAMPFTGGQDTTFATSEIGEPSCGDGLQTVWYRWTASASGTLRVGSDGNSVGVYRGSSVDQLNRLACSWWTADVDVFAGKTYYFQLESTAAYAGMSARLLGGIEGRVQGPGGGPAGGVCVQTDGPLERITTLSASDGSYRLESLDPGSYVVEFGCGRAPYGSVWYPQALSPDDATPVVVAHGSVTADIDARLGPPTTISGTITPGGTCASAFTPSGRFVASSPTDDQGVYRLFVPPGDFKVKFDGCGPYAALVEWFDDAPTFESAQTVTAISGQDTPNIDAELIVSGPAINDAIENAEQIGAFPYRTVSFADRARRDSGEPEACGNTSWPQSVWYRLTPSETATVVVSPDGHPLHSGALDAYVDGGRLPGYEDSLVKVACTRLDAGVDRLAFVAEAGKTYYVQHTVFPFDGPVRLIFDETTAAVTTTVDAPIPCAAVCAPVFAFPEACTTQARGDSIREIPIEVPALVDGYAPADLAVHARMTGDADTVLCREDTGEGSFVAWGDSGRSQDCLWLGCDETYAIAVTPGERYVLRVFNYLNVGPVDVTTSFRRKR